MQSFDLGNGYTDLALPLALHNPCRPTPFAAAARQHSAPSAVSAPLFRAAHGTYLGDLAISSEMHNSSSATPGIISSSLNTITNMTFVMEMRAAFNPATRGTDCAINATIVSCSSAGAAGLEDCMQSCTLLLFNDARYTATFAQDADGSFNPSSFQIAGGVNASFVLASCAASTSTDMGDTALMTSNLLMLLAEQVDTRCVCVCVCVLH